MNKVNLAVSFDIATSLSNGCSRGAMEYDQIQYRFQNELRGYWGHEDFTANSFLDLLSLMDSGARRMVAEGRSGEEDMQEAIQALHRFMDEMTAERDRRGFTDFREETVSQARFRLCPIFPFC
jgi:hypothetical protein